MANFRLLPSGKWNAQVRVKGKSPQSKTFSTKAEAVSWANQIEAVTMDRKHHTIYTLGMMYCETMLKGKGSYDHALKIVEHLGRHFTLIGVSLSDLILELEKTLDDCPSKPSRDEP